MSKVLILSSLLLSCVLPIKADGLAFGAHISLRHKKENTFKILKDLLLSHSIDGFEVNCNKKIIIVWGKPKTLNPSNPQLSRITLIDAKRKKINWTLVVSSGIFGVRYLQDEESVYLESNPESLLKISTGLLLPVNENALDNLKFEKCDGFPQKSYLKYAK